MLFVSKVYLGSSGGIKNFHISINKIHLVVKLNLLHYVCSPTEDADVECFHVELKDMDGLLAGLQKGNLHWSTARLLIDETVEISKTG